MDLANHAKKFGILYLAGAILIGCVIVALAILSRPPKSGGGKETDEHVAGNHKKGHDKDPDKVQLWEGGPYWADRNVGAEEPWDYGYYFWWGDTVGYKFEDGAWVASDGSSKKSREGRVPTAGKDSLTLQREGWITADGVLAPKHDAAQVQWGGEWRMPTKQELDDLYKKCDWTWTTTKGVNGYVVRGRGNYAFASIFLPCAGEGDGASLYAVGSGFYWSSVTDLGSDFRGLAWGLHFNSSHRYTFFTYRSYGLSVRPVQGGAK